MPHLSPRRGPRPVRSAYQEARARARTVEYRMKLGNAVDMRRSLLRFADGLERRLARFPAQPDARAIQATADLARAVARDYLREIEPVINNGRILTFEKTRAVWDRAQAQAFQTTGVNPAAVQLGAIRIAPLPMLQIFNAVGSPDTWQTLLRSHVANAAGEAAEIMRAGFIEGIGPDEMARRLRRYVVGSEPFQKLFTNVPTVAGDVAKIDLRTIPRSLRDSARQMAYNAERIAVSENHNTKMAAETQFMIEDPWIEAAQWTLSPAHEEVDECDVLATEDVYGLGPGIYPVLQVPGPPHPFDGCEEVPIIRDEARLADPKPNPDRVRGMNELRVPDRGKITPNAEQRIRERAHAAIEEVRSKLESKAALAA